MCSGWGQNVSPREDEASWTNIVVHSRKKDTHRVLVSSLGTCLDGSVCA